MNDYNSKFKLFLLFHIGFSISIEFNKLIHLKVLLIYIQKYYNNE